jgi:hypothetical protein
MKNKLIYPLILSLISCFLFLGISHTQAATFIINGSSAVPLNQDFKVDVMIDADGENLNAFEGAITFPNRLLKIKQMNDGDSIVSFWIERPHLASSTDPQIGKVAWSGITPQGFQSILGPYFGGKPGKLFSVVFAPGETGSGQITVLDLRALIGDGKGSSAKVSAAPFHFSINGTAEGNLPAHRDLNPPENFRPEIASDPSIWNGEYFLAFAAADKESGIGHYEILETRNKERGTEDWTIAESPYLLKDQKLSSFIFVKAVDKAGNERTEKLEPLRPRGTWYENEILWIIIIGVLVVLGINLLWKRKRKK